MKSKKSENLHGSAPSSARQALLLIDVINDLDFPGGEALARKAPALARKIRKLSERARAAGVPVIYVNDNFGKWRSDFRSLIEHCTDGRSPGCALAGELLPRPEDYFVLKPEKSAFHQTPLPMLLRHLGVESLILAGLTTDSCVFLTASDAHMRDYRVSVASDCVTAIREAEHRFFLKQMRKNLKARVESSPKIRFSRSSG